MFYNGAECDVYIGKSAGKKLLEEVRNAKKSVRIVSPYLSPLLVEELIEIRKKDIQVQLVTTDSIEDFEGSKKNIKELIIQNRVTDYDAVNQRQKWKSRLSTLSTVNIVLFILFLIGGYHYQELEMLFGLIPIVSVHLYSQSLSKRIKNKRIFNYWYSQLFPFKVFGTRYSASPEDTFIHSKIYIIDDKIAYLGSLNFTLSGAKYNYESRIRTQDPQAVQKIIEEFNLLMNHKGFSHRNIQHWGSMIYDEPIN